MKRVHDEIRSVTIVTILYTYIDIAKKIFILY